MRVDQSAHRLPRHSPIALTAVHGTPKGSQPEKKRTASHTDSASTTPELVSCGGSVGGGRLTELLLAGSQRRTHKRNAETVVCMVHRSIWKMAFARTWPSGAGARPSARRSRSACIDG